MQKCQTYQCYWFLTVPLDSTFPEKFDAVKPETKTVTTLKGFTLLQEEQ